MASKDAPVKGTKHGIILHLGWPSCPGGVSTERAVPLKVKVLRPQQCSYGPRAECNVAGAQSPALCQVAWRQGYQATQHWFCLGQH